MRCGVVFSLILSIIVMLSMITSSSSAQAPSEWSDPVQIIDTMVWDMESCEDTIFAYGYDASVCCEDAGDTWGSEKAFNGMVASADGKLYRANMTDWQEYGDTILFSKSDDLGDTWSDTVEVMTLDGYNDYAFGIYVLDATLFIYTYDWAGTDYGYIMLSRSTDYGATWSEPVVVDPYVHVEDPWTSDMVLWKGKVYMAYWNYSYEYPEFDNVVLIESSDMGETWENRQVIAEGVLPSLKADDDMLYVSYLSVTDDADVGVHFTRSLDGTTWSTPIGVGPMTGFSDMAVWHSMAVHGDRIFVAYTDIDTSGPEYTYTVRLNHSADRGATWDDMGDVTGGNGDEMWPVLATTESRIHLTWMDAMGLNAWSMDNPSVYRYLVVEPEPGIDRGPLAIPVVLLVVAVGTIVSVFAIRRTWFKSKPPA